MYVYPECAHEWAKDAGVESSGTEGVVNDAYGNTLNDGYTVTVIKDLKIKGSSSVVKVGTNEHHQFIIHEKTGRKRTDVIGERT